MESACIIQNRFHFPNEILKSASNTDNIDFKKILSFLRRCLDSYFKDTESFQKH